MNESQAQKLRPCSPLEPTSSPLFTEAFLRSRAGRNSPRGSALERQAAA